MRQTILKAPPFKPSERAIRRIPAGKRPFYRELHEIADRLNPRVRRDFRDAIERIKGTVIVDELERAVLSGREQEVLEILGLESKVAAQAGLLIASLAQVFERSARSTLDIMPKQVRQSMTFDMTNPESVRFLEQYRLGLISPVAVTRDGQNVGITAATRDGIREIIRGGFEEGFAPREMARQIRDNIGLNRRQARTWLNHRAMLVEEGVTGKKLRDKMDRFYQRLLRQRALNIARTETIRASNAGQQAVWDQAQRQGLLDPQETRRIWIVTPDDRLCFPAKTLVMTSEGWRQIRTLKVGDLVLTHKDRFRRVISTRWERYNGPVVRMKLGGRARIQATATYGHPILTDRGWVPVEELTNKDKVWIAAKHCADCRELIPSGPGARVTCPSCSAKRSNKTRWAKPESAEWIKQHNERRWADPKQREKARELALANNVMKRPEVREKVRDKALERYMDPVQRERQAEHNRRNAKLPDHPFNKLTKEDRERIRKLAMQARGRKSNGISYLERKLKWFLEKQELEFKTQWEYRYGEGKQGFADFYLPGPNLVIECDGYYHTKPEVAESDKVKTESLMEQGYDVLRFTDAQIRQEFPDVISEIRRHCCFMTAELSVEHADIKRQTVYDIQVEEDMSFVAGGIVAHNCEICKAIPPANREGRRLDEPFASPVQGTVVPHPPAHPRCRCAMGLRFEEG